MDLLGDSDLFPKDWLFKHRWGKGKKNDPGVLPNGEKVIFITVGGRTSAIVPSVQKKSGSATKDSPSDTGTTSRTTPKRKRAATPKKEDSDDAEEKLPAKKPTSRKQESKAGSKPAKETPSGTRRSSRVKK